MSNKSDKAKELCAMLITRSLKDLNEDEEDIVVDYLEKIGIDVDIDAKPKEMCLVLLENMMEKELGRRVPITAYANTILLKTKEVKDEKIKQVKLADIKLKRRKSQVELEKKSKTLPGCVPAEQSYLSENLYNLTVDPDLGIVRLNDGTSQYTAVVSLSNDLYSKIFLNVSTPILEISTSKGGKAYARLGEPHNGSNDVVYISPLIATILNVSQKEGAFLKLCVSLPEIKKVKFTYYGEKAELDNILSLLIEKLPSVVNAFSYLSLGMVLLTDIQGKEVSVRVDALSDEDERPIFAGIIPFAEGDLPFEIESDL